jgi:lipopolysaccharide transport protein LptA
MIRGGDFAARIFVLIRGWMIIGMLLLTALFVFPVMPRAETVQIESDRLEIVHKSKKAIFSGKVRFTRGDFELQADKLVAHYEQDSVSKGITRARASGHVIMSMGDKQGRSEEAEIDQRNGIIRLIGHAEITQKSGTIRGGTIIYNMKEDTINVLQGDSERVRVHIESTQDLKSPSK